VNNGSVIVPSGTTYTWSVLDNTSISGEANNSTAVNSISQTLTNSTNSQTSVSYTITPISGSSGNCVGSNFNVNLTVKPNQLLPIKISVFVVLLPTLQIGQG
jgi:hypothetical protein